MEPPEELMKRQEHLQRKGTPAQYKRRHLFLVRLWVAGSSQEATVPWKGSVQRVVDGESLRFSSLQGLVDSLQVLALDNYGGQESEA